MRPVRRRHLIRTLPLLTAFLVLLPASVQAQTIVWTRQFGTTRDDVALDAAADSTDVYIAGYSNIWSSH